jgi:hypothetical protein
MNLSPIWKPWVKKIKFSESYMIMKSYIQDRNMLVDKASKMLE